MRIKFWGVRGSIPTPEHRNSRYGGNTTCVEVRLNDGTLIILDCGSGLRGLGNSLLREFGQEPVTGYIFLTHFHWDHIQGIPFFAPLYKSGSEFHFHAVRRKEQELAEVIQGQIANPYFPVDMRVLSSTRRICDLDYGPRNIKGAIVSSAPLNHPQGCVAYRVEADGCKFVLATDTEPGSALHDRSLRELARGADVLVYDSQYTPEQLQGAKKGWGHSSWLEGTRIAKECGVKQLILIHHDPEHDDDFIDNIVQEARREFPEVIGAAEGLELKLPQEEMVHAYEPSTPRQERRFVLEVPVHVIWRDDRGEKKATGGFVRNISRSTIYFMVPSFTPADRPLELDFTLPDEIREHGMLAMRFTVRAMRTEQVAAAPRHDPSWMGMVAQLAGEHRISAKEPGRLAFDTLKAQNGNGQQPVSHTELKLLQKVG
ncbi:MAG TPA: MBL fold metallo-hydrolase [Terriglobia bacterium]|nr:MBL fold metallo-hydrolase [Terriglobia bacterium]